MGTDRPIRNTVSCPDELRGTRIRKVLRTPLRGFGNALFLLGKSGRF